MTKYFMKLHSTGQSEITYTEMHLKQSYIPTLGGEVCYLLQ